MSHDRLWIGDIWFSGCNYATPTVLFSLDGGLRSLSASLLLKEITHLLLCRFQEKCFSVSPSPSGNDHISTPCFNGFCSANWWLFTPWGSFITELHLGAVVSVGKQWCEFDWWACTPMEETGLWVQLLDDVIYTAVGLWVINCDPLISTLFLYCAGLSAPSPKLNRQHQSLYVLFL